MGQVVAVVSGKGGTGKTSFVANVGMALALMGYKTLCLDCDVGLRNLDIAMAMTDQAVMDFTDVIQRSCSLEEAAVPHPLQNGLFLLTAPGRPLDEEINQDSFRWLLDNARKNFDYCLVDAPAGLGSGFHLAVSGAQRAVVVTTTDSSSLRDAQHTTMELASIPHLHLVVNRCKRKLMKRLHQTIDDAIDTAGLPLLGVVPEDDSIPLYTGRGTPLLLTGNRCAAQAYRNIARRMTGTRTPLMKIR